MKPDYQFNSQDEARERARQQEPISQRCYAWFWVLLSWIGLACIGLALFQQGYLSPARWEAFEQWVGAPSTLRGRVSEYDRLLTVQTQQLANFELELSKTKRALSVQETANSELRKQMALVESERLDIEQKSLVCASILSPDELKPGLHIQYFGMKPKQLDADGNRLLAKDRYQYHLVLSHIRAEAAVVEGKFNLQILGKLARKNVTLSQSDLVIAGQVPTDSFSLKYYQSIEGEVQLPAGFEPEQVIVTATPNNEAAAVTMKYAWDSVKQSDNVPSLRSK